MALKIGNDYMVWVAAAGGTPTYGLLGGQQDGSLSVGIREIDGSHKTSGSTDLVLPGNKTYNLPLSFNAELPDATGYSVVETRLKGRLPILVQIRKGGATGASPADVVFACEMYALNLDLSFPLNGIVSGSMTFKPAAAPTTDLTLA